MQSELLLPDAKDAGAASESKAHDVPVPVAAAVRDGGDAADGDAADGDAAGAPESKLADGDAADTTVEPEVPAHPPSRLAQKHAEALAAGTRRAGAGAASAGAGADAAAGGMASDIAAFADGSVAALSFDLSNNDNWEYVFINTAAAALPQAGTGVGAGAGAGAAAGEEEELGRIDLDTGLPLNAEEAAEADAEAAAATGADDGGEHVLDLPPSWVPKLVLDRDLYELRYSPAGSRTTVFHKTKLEQYAPFVHPEGMLQRCTFYENVARTQVHRVVEVFGNRTDKLVKRVRLLLDQLVQECVAACRGVVCAVCPPFRFSSLTPSSWALQVLCARAPVRFAVECRTPGQKPGNALFRLCQDRLLGACVCVVVCRGGRVRVALLLLCHGFDAAGFPRKSAQS